MLERRVHKHKRGGELCCKIFAVFWRISLGPVCKGCSRNPQKRKFSEKWAKEILDTRFLRWNISSPTEVKKPQPTSCRIFTHFTIWAKTHYKVTYLATTCNTPNCLPKDPLPHVQNPLTWRRPKVILTWTHTQLTFWKRENKMDTLLVCFSNKLV